jgi:copper chaperone CopZ
METVSFTVPSITSEREALDVANVLNSLSGVAHIDTDTVRHTVTVRFDRSHAGPDLFQGAIDGAGYPVQEPKDEE